MGSDELNGSKTNPFMSKELFNYVWMINPNSSIPLTIYLSNQAPCTRQAAALATEGKKKQTEQDGEEQKNKSSKTLRTAADKMHIEQDIVWTSCC